MWKVHFAVVTVLASLGKIECSGPPAGKCDTKDLIPVPLTVKEMEKHLHWKVYYETEFGRPVDHESYSFIVLGGQNYVLDNLIVRNNNNQSKYHAIMKYIDNVLIEDTNDERGSRHQFYMYPMAVTKSLGLLIYRCSDVGSDDVDYRLIAFPEDGAPSESEFQQLIDLDKQIFKGRRGRLIKLPDKIKD